METIRLSIIGMGRMGITHFSIINSHPRVEVVSVSDTSKVVLDILKRMYRVLRYLPIIRK